MLLNSAARDFSDAYTKEKIVSRLVASMALLALAASLTGCAVAPGYDYAYAQPYYYYPGYGYPYGPPYAPVYGSIGIWGGWGGPCCYHGGGGGHWHGGHGDWHGGGWHGSGFGGSHDGTWSSGGGHGGHGH